MVVSADFGIFGGMFRHFSLKVGPLRQKAPPRSAYSVALDAAADSLRRDRG
jgi:hypothetical protein